MRPTIALVENDRCKQLLIKYFLLHFEGQGGGFLLAVGVDGGQRIGCSFLWLDGNAAAQRNPGILRQLG